MYKFTWWFLSCLSNNSSFEIVADKFKKHNVRETYVEALEASSAEATKSESDNKTDLC